MDKKSATNIFKYFYNFALDLMFVAYDGDKPVGNIMSLLKRWWDGMHLEDGEIFVLKEKKWNCKKNYLNNYLNIL